MKTTTDHVYHGIALAQIVQYQAFKALNRADSLYGHYVVNDKIRLFVKYATRRVPPWSFTFRPRDWTAIKADIHSGAKTFAILVCGDKTVCCLDQQELSELLNFTARGARGITVTTKPRSSLTVRGGGTRKLPRQVPHDAFPQKIFG